MGFKKRGAVYSVIALMLCVAVYLNWNYSRVGNSEEDLNVGNKILGESVLVDGQDAFIPSAGEDGSLPVTLPSPEGAGSDYFSQARLSRQKARDEAVNILNSTVESVNSTEDSKTVASTNIQLMADNAMMESRIENMVIAKGYADCVVFVNDNGINVIIPKTEAGITQTDVARIKDIVMDEASVGADKIKIMDTQ